MPTKKQTKKKNPSFREYSDPSFSSAELETKTSFPRAFPDRSFSPDGRWLLGKLRLKKTQLALLALVIVAVVVFLNKNLIVVAIVNDRPIWRWEFEEKLINRFAPQVQDELIIKELLNQQAAAANLRVESSEIQTKYDQAVKSLGGEEALKQYLSDQGRTLSEFRQEIRLQILLEKLTADQIKISDEEIASYIKENQDYLPATDEATLREHVKNTLLSQKQGETYRDYFEKLRGSAKIQKFL